MAGPKYIRISTERGSVEVREDLVWGNSKQTPEDKAAEHLATGSTVYPSTDKMPKVVHSDSNGPKQ